MALNTVQAIINGQTYSLTYNSQSGKWEGTITAPSTTSYHETNNKYGVTITAEDQAGNITTKDRNDTTLGEDLQLRVLEKVKPTITISSPSSGARVTNAAPTIQLQLRDTGAGINLSSLQLRIDGGTVITKDSPGMIVNSVPGGYDCSFLVQSALSEGGHTITINAQDNDGNTADTVTVTFTVDTAPPALNVSSPLEGLVTNNATITVTGTTNDETSTPVTVTMKLNGVDQGTVNVSAGTFSKSISLTEGANTIVIRATDAAGLFSEVTRHVTLDTIAPTISGVTITPNPVDCGKTFIISVTVSD